MQYLGSKKNLAKHILPMMLAERSFGQWWVEPFVGGANMIDKVDEGRIGNDIHPYLIDLLVAVRDGYVPPEEVSRDMYYEIKQSPQNYPNELVGFVGFLCSFGGKWWGGYASNKSGYNYAKGGSRSLVRQAKTLKNVILVSGCYTELDIPPNSLIYCDPPYANMTSYSTSFNHVLFWEWCRCQAKDGHTVFVSEYDAPEDFECVLEIEHTTKLNRNKISKRTEKLFRLSL